VVVEGIGTVKFLKRSIMGHGDRYAVFEVNVFSGVVVLESLGTFVRKLSLDSLFYGRVGACDARRWHIASVIEVVLEVGRLINRDKERTLAIRGCWIVLS
jgi:hypothetical protein